MYYRRKLLLGVLEANGGLLNKTRLQKLLLLITRMQEVKTYDFVPYQFGCFSFTANQDLNTLIKYGLVSENKTQNGSSWVKSTDESFFNQLKDSDKAAILNVTRVFKEKSNEDLVIYTYKKYPFWAINSTIAKKILSEEDYNNVLKQKSTKTEKGLYTIGYEGLSIENYINKLLINNISVLCDVRKNSLSMKYGFSKSQLKNACEGVGIEYLHVPELGIDSEQRQELNSLKDYQILFEKYEQTTLKEREDKVQDLITLVKSKGRIAITCFEKEHCMCHRGKVAEKLVSMDKSIKVTHL
jgi:uncharacterized protein (DUF488 family)